MAKHAHDESAPPRFVRAASSVLDWHDARPRASMSSPRGWVWAALIAAVFFWMSNPLVFVPGFHLSLPKAITWTTVAVVVTLPWLRLPRAPWPWVAFHALTYASLLWTIDPHVTGYTALLYLKITAIGLVIAANCEADVACWGFGLGGMAVVALSIYAFQEEMWGASYLALEGVVFSGIGTNQNILAYTVALALAATMAIGWPRRVVARLAWLVTSAVNLYGIYLARSSTGYLATICIILCAVAVAGWPRMRSGGRRRIVLWTGGASGLLLLAVLGVVTFFGDQFSTLSGRSPFWLATIRASFDSAPMLGSGWGAVWQHPWGLTPPNEVSDDIYARAGFQLSHGHNLVLDVLPELGLLGVAATLLMVAYTAREVVRCGLHEGGRDPLTGRLALLVLVALLVSGMTEPMFTVPLGWWSLLLVVALARQRVLRRPDQSNDAADDERADTTKREATGVATP